MFTPEFTQKLRALMRLLHEQERLHKHSPRGFNARNWRQRLIGRIRWLRTLVEEDAGHLHRHAARD